MKKTARRSETGSGRLRLQADELVKEQRPVENQAWAKLTTGDEDEKLWQVKREAEGVESALALNALMTSQNKGSTTRTSQAKDSQQRIGPASRSFQSNKASYRS